MQDTGAKRSWAEWAAVATLLILVVALAGSGRAAEQLQMTSPFGDDGGFSKVSQAVMQAAAETPDQPLPLIVTYARTPGDADIEQLTVAERPEGSG